MSAVYQVPPSIREIQHKQGRHGNLVGILREDDLWQLVKKNQRGYKETREKHFVP